MGPEGEAGAVPSLSAMQSWVLMHACIHGCVFWGGWGRRGQVLLHGPSISFMQAGYVLGRETTPQGSTLQQLLKVSASTSNTLVLSWHHSFIIPQFVNDFLGESDLAEAGGFERVT